MNVLNNTINRISYIIKDCPDKIKLIPEQELLYKRSPEKWSKKEILGHLCDSAVNNLNRFVRAQSEPQPFKVVDYDQNSGVKVNNYQSESLENIINFWVTVNGRIIAVLSAMPEEKLGISCDAGKPELKSLLWLIEDYLAHMEYHLAQIIGSEFKPTTSYKA
jgi:hypothetical protein